MAEENTTLELTRLYCCSLRPFNFFRKPALYAAVSLVSDTGNCVSDQKYQTETDKVGGCNPNWDASSISLDIIKPFLEQEPAVFVKFEVFCQRSILLPDKKVAEVKVALKTLVDDFEGADRFQKYRVKGHGKKASLHFSFKLVNGTKIKNDGAAGCKVSYFSSLGTQFSVESIVMAPPRKRQVQRCYSTDAGSIDSQPVSYRLNSRGGRMLVTEINHDEGNRIKEENVSGKHPISGLQLTGYGCELDRYGGSFYANRLL